VPGAAEATGHFRFTSVPQSARINQSPIANRQSL
jgi:hypothetical protein